MTDQLQIEESIFLRALELPDDADRGAFLDQVCGDDVMMRAGVEKLLRAHSKAGDLLDLPDSTETTNEIAEQPVTEIGPYKLLEPLGEGGFGVVFLAEQGQPVRRKVALKIIKPGMDTRQVIARFEAERQALAMMDHPNIAKVHDAGATDNGRPYFVMELVQGVPITEYCDQCNLTTRERLVLFITVCHAVQHAHQKGVIHRDIKPTNVLVAMQDGRPAPKIIDFGVAKAINQQLTEHTLTTAFAQMIGSPLYMSPEQAELSPLGVDTRSDIYSLGVMLYELLAGTTPFDKDRLHGASYDELRRIIRDEEPPRPSARISTLAADLATTVAERRCTDTRHLSQQVRGELDWIVMKCLEKDRNRRYETPSSLARDIERYLNDEPVTACPPSASYRFRKFARRNKALLAGGGAIAAALAVGLGLSTWQYFRATTESARAQAVSNLLQEMLGSADAARAKGVDYKVRELLDDFAAGLDSQLADEPAVEADIHATIGRAYRSVQRPDQAQPHFEKAIQLRRQNDGPRSVKLAEILVDYGWNLRDQQRFSEAESQLKEALDIYRGQKISGAPVFHALEILQHVLISSNRDEDAERVTRQALEIARRESEELPDQANLLHRYAGFKIKQGHFAEAEKLASQSVEMHRRLHGEHHPETGWGLRMLASALRPQQKLVEAETALRQSLAIFRRQFPEDHSNIRDTNYELRMILEARGDKSALESLAKEEEEYEMRFDSPGYHARLAGRLLKYKSSDREAKNVARQLIQRAIEEYSQTAVDSPDDLERRLKAAQGFVNLVKLCVAEPGLSNELDELNRRLEVELPKLFAAAPEFSDTQWQTGMTYRAWAAELHSYGAHLPTVEHAYRESIKILEKLPISDPTRPGTWTYLADSYTALALVCERLAKPTDAEEAFRRVREILDQRAAEIAADPVHNINLGIATDSVQVALHLGSSHREVQAIEWLRKAAQAASRVKEPADSVNALGVTAIAQLRLGDQAGYRETCKALADVSIADGDYLTKGRALFALCLGPDALADRSLPVKRAEEYAAHNTLDQPHFGPYLLGAALYRNSQYARAADELEKSIAASPSDPPREGVEINSQRVDVNMINQQRLFLAMTKWQLGHQDEVRQLLAETQAAIHEEFQCPTDFVFSRISLEILRREAEALIEQKEEDEAVENNSRTSYEPEHPQP